VNTDRGPLRIARNLVFIPLVLIGTFVGNDSVISLPLMVAGAVVGSLGWVVAGFRPSTPTWLTPAALVAVAAGGLMCIAGVERWSTAAAFLFYAILMAGWWWRATTSIAFTVLILVGLVFAAPPANTTGTAVGALLLVIALLFGMSRRESTKRQEQAELTATATARAQEEHARAAALAERGRIARDVHDVLAHSLSALAVQLQGARLMVLRDGAPADTVAQIERAQRLAQEGLAEARRAVTALRTPPVDIADGLRALVADTPHASLEIEGEPPVLDATARETLLRTAQEALSNVRKHAGGAPVTVRLASSAGATELEVRDRTGSRPARGEGGFGLVGMAERAALAGATLDAGPVDDGWRVHLVLPARIVL
jgi:signal transduction histidine kinase